MRTRLPSQPHAADTSASLSYFACPRTDADATLRLTADTGGRTLMRPSKVAFSLQPYICDAHVMAIDSSRL